MREVSQFEEHEKEISLREKSLEHESANLEIKRSELVEREKTLAERMNQIEEQEEQVGLRAKSLEEESVNLEIKRSELAAQEQINCRG